MSESINFDDLKQCLTTSTLHFRDRVRLVQLCDQLVLHDGLLYRRFVNTDNYNGHLQLVVPGIYHNDILQELHFGVVEGHISQDKTLSHLKEFFTGLGSGMMLISGVISVLRVQPERFLLS